MSTPYHARYFAYELTRQGPAEDSDRLTQALFDAYVDLNPHQVEAALFALRSPVSKGVILADEVGLGKTIEAGLVLCQYWAERRRRLLVICPASLRKQWALELEEKFNLPTHILDAKSYREARNSGNPNPFEQKAVVIVSLNFANRLRDDVKQVGWDLAVIDEAHKLRNVYRASNKTGQGIKWALEDRRKVLLTATPLQNSLLELYGLATLIDERIFGDLPSFRTQYANTGGDLESLRERLRPFCKRTLRRHVLEYIRYTERRAITRPFRPTDNEQKLYEAVSEFLEREDTYTIPAAQRQLTILVLHKILASSSKALIGTLETMKERLGKMRDDTSANLGLLERIIAGEEIEDEYLDELLAIDEEKLGDVDDHDQDVEKAIDLKKLNGEILELQRFIDWARSIQVDTKTRSLLSALDIGFTEMEKMGAALKGLIFTESRRTQQYLHTFLEANGYAGKIVLFSGTNTDPDSRVIYERWLAANADSGRSCGNRQVDQRTALIEHFRDHAEIMIATEAASEGVNLQFCSLVVNYDLPWNPQRIEQRIGRCHRYGQKHDVVVINFLNERNHADQRVYELLNQKFNLFEGVFGASDEVLGSLESGVDFEKRILAIYEQCRTTEEIDSAFKKLQDELDEQIRSRMDQTRQSLLEHFDEDVHARLKWQMENSRQSLDKFTRIFWDLTRFILSDCAVFNDEELSFDLKATPLATVQPGHYQLISKVKANIPGEFLYRLSHPLGEFSIETGKRQHTPEAEVVFDVSNHPTRISLVEQLKGKSGWLHLQRLIVESFDREEYLLFSGMTDQGASLDQETCSKLFFCQGRVSGTAELASGLKSKLDADVRRHSEATLNQSLEANNQFFNEERDRLEKWADDMVLAAEKELKDTKELIKTLNRQARQAPTVEEQHQVQGKIREAEKKQRRLRQQVFDVEDEILEKRNLLIEKLEMQMSQKTDQEGLFTIRWQVI